MERVLNQIDQYLDRETWDFTKREQERERYPSTQLDTFRLFMENQLQMKLVQGRESMNQHKEQLLKSLKQGEDLNLSSGMLIELKMVLDLFFNYDRLHQGTRF